MISEMFNRITKGPARADMVIESKKNKGVSIEVWHWYRSDEYCVEYHDFHNIDHRIIARCTCWSDAFKFIADYVLENDF